MNDLQNRLASTLKKMQTMKRISEIEWCEWNIAKTYCGVLFRDEEGKVVVIPLHAPDFKEDFQIDSILLSLMLNRVFRENTVACPYSYPLNLKWCSGLVNDARQLFRMKMSGGSTDDFEFHYCLPDVRKEEMHCINEASLEMLFSWDLDDTADSAQFEHFFHWLKNA